MSPYTNRFTLFPSHPCDSMGFHYLILVFGSSPSSLTTGSWCLLSNFWYLWSTSRHWLIRILKNTTPYFFHVLPKYYMNIHVRMITLCVHICCSALNVFQKRITSGTKQSHNNIAITCLSCFHQWCFFSNRLAVNINWHLLLWLHAHLQKESYRCFITGSSCMV